MNKLNFKTWTHENLVSFATECYARLVAEQVAVEQLRLDLKDAMQMARQNNLQKQR